MFVWSMPIILYPLYSKFVLGNDFTIGEVDDFKEGIKVWALISHLIPFNPKSGF